MSRIPCNILDRFILVHVGKCAGGTISRELSMAGFNFECVHLRKPPLVCSLNYIILIRDPVERFVSAFCWRKHILSSRLKNEKALSYRDLSNLKNSMELEFLSHYQNANQLAEEIDPFHPNRGLHGSLGLINLIGHIPTGFSWYLDDLLEHPSRKRIIAAIAVETLPRDLDTVFGIKSVFKDKSSYPEKNHYLSDQSRRNLADLFSAEYRALRKLSLCLSEGGGYRPDLLNKLSS
jgi:hypothetical protein